MRSSQIMNLWLFIRILALASAVLIGLPAHSQPVPQTVASALRAAAIAPGEYGVVALPLDGGPPLIAHNELLAFNPASTMKLVTTYAALSLLGANYRWHTPILIRGSIDDGVLDGDLVLRGGGDPKLVIEDMVEMVSRLRALGLKVIRGNLVIDDSLYEIGDESTEKFDGDPSQPYNVRPYAAMMNFKATKVTVRPQSSGLAIDLDPPLADVGVIDEVRVLGGPCRHGIAGLAIRDSGTDQKPLIRVAGSYSSACGEQSTMTAVLNHRQFIQAFFGSAWRVAGGVWEGRAVIERRVDPRLPVLMQWTSPRTLADVVKDINKYSNNVMARQLMLQTSTDLPRRRPATLERARKVIIGWLEKRGLRSPEIVIDNGSGLSRQERISPMTLARVLIDAAQSADAPVFLQSLPVVGVDGTMKSRLKTDPVAGNAWIKTGSLNDVRSIAGYVDAASGRRYTVVMMINGPRAEGSSLAQDALLKWIYANG
ncbi:MAG: D-alanyl-D-alanine carboxypeptidase/D-alanyl-D-alanine-endopeptidase [Burkholderiales bacterium]